ncbi:hypothetical protein As57867_004035, partial [Aphanomyces stellatus]
MGAGGSVQTSIVFDAAKFDATKDIMGLACDDTEKFNQLQDVWWGEKPKKHEGIDDDVLVDVAGLFGGEEGGGGETKSAQDDSQANASATVRLLDNPRVVATRAGGAVLAVSPVVLSGTATHDQHHSHQPMEPAGSSSRPQSPESPSKGVGRHHLQPLARHNGPSSPSSSTSPQPTLAPATSVVVASPADVSILPKLDLPHGYLDIDADRVVYVLPKVASPWKYRPEPMPGDVVVQEYERVTAFIDEFQRREEATAWRRQHPAKQRRSAKTSPRKLTSLQPTNNHSPHGQSHPTTTPLVPDDASSPADYIHVSSGSYHPPRFIPVTLDEQHAFWDAIEAYHRTRMARIAHDRALGVCVYDFNAAAAGDPELLAARHTEWVDRRDRLADDCAEARVRRADAHDVHIQQTTTDYRIYLRHLRQEQAAHLANVRVVLPRVLAMAAAQTFVQRLWLHWDAVRRTRV